MAMHGVPLLSHLFDEPSAGRFSDRESDASDMRAIQEFLDEAMITEVLNVVKSGKEATVYRCRAHPSLGVPFAAVKCYHSAVHRSFQRAARYEEGRVIGNGQVARAIRNRTGFGREAQLALWVDHEFEVLGALHDAGADVPEPFACTDTAVLMELLGDESGAAPQLQSARISPGEADALLGRVLWNIELFLRENVVHADLSAFNILHVPGRLAIIDFPQAVDPRTNPSARSLLERDLRNVLGYFSRHQAGVHEDPGSLARRLWNRWRHAEL